MRKTQIQTEANDDLLLAARVLELWRLCGKSACRRARACHGDARRCCERIADWDEAFLLKPKTKTFGQCLEDLRAKQSG